MKMNDKKYTVRWKDFGTTKTKDFATEEECEQYFKSVGYDPYQWYGGRIKLAQIIYKGKVIRGSEKANVYYEE